MADVKVTRNDAESRYELHVSDETHHGTLAGYASFEQGTGRVRFTATEIDPAFRGQGLGDTLASEALADVAQRGDTIIPLCPFIAAHLQQNEVAGAIVEWPGDTPLDSATQGESPE
ncbi:GNAT family N-acetyltransferase [Microbacterium sp. NPDC096154]|uniref:GNAT family N-acetyltransferase n=1 Tax=Microbacterium sp. NPDC096154 TaxID=3155549 RepID=UPI00331D5CC0